MRIMYSVYDTKENLILDWPVSFCAEYVANIWATLERKEPERYEIVRGYEESDEN